MDGKVPGKVWKGKTAEEKAAEANIKYRNNHIWNKQ